MALDHHGLVIVECAVDPVALGDGGLDPQQTDCRNEPSAAGT
jgi:hypothetical protein